MSFSAEIADFVKGFQAGSQVGGDIMDRKARKEEAELARAYKDKDFEFEREKFGYTKERDKDNRSHREKLAEERRARADRQDKRAEAASRRADEALKLRREALELGSLNTLGTAPGAAPGGSYVDDYPIEEVAETEVDIPDMEEEQEFKRGGLVAYANTGGAIPEEPPVEEPVIEQSGKTDLLTEQVKPILKEVFDDEAANIGDKKPEAIATKPKKDQSRISVISGEGAATPDEIKAMDKLIDPENQMQPFRKGAQRLVTAYNFFIEKGETEKARNVAKRIVGFHNQAARVQGQLALAALERGDLRATSKLVTDAYNENIMDGNTIEAQPTPRGTVMYKTDNKAFAQQQGELGAQQLWSLASGMADGSAFLDSMTDLAATAKSKGKGSYSADVKAAAQAKKAYDELRRELGSDPIEDAEKKQLSDAYSAYEAAMAKAETAAEKTKRPRKVLEEDLSRTYRNTSVPPPAQAVPEAPAEAAGEESGILPGWVNRAINSTIPGGGDWFGVQERRRAQEAQQAIPAQPGAPAAPAQPAPQAAPVTVRSKEELDALPPNTVFIAPDGTVRRKP